LETFRCPTCLGMLVDPTPRRCPCCRQNVRRRRPKVLGEETRIGSTLLPIDRWMLARLNTKRSHTAPDIAAPPSPLPEPTEVVPATVGALALDVYTRPVRPEADVRALVDQLYEQARAELSGNDVGFFTPSSPPDEARDPSPDDEPPPSDLNGPGRGSGAARPARWFPA
jgi:hypothetical protein